MASCLAFKMKSTNTPYAGEAGILPQRKEKLTMGKLKPSHLSYSLVENLSELSVTKRQFQYKVAFVDSVMSLVSSSLG